MASIFSMGGSDGRNLSIPSLNKQGSRQASSDYVLASDESTHAPENTINKLEDNSGSPPTQEEQDSSLEGAFGRAHAALGILVNHKIFHWTIFYCILLNSLAMAIDTFDFVSNDPTVDHAFDLIDYIFLLIFTFELLIHLTYYGLAFFTDGWLLFDLSIITLSWAFVEFSVFRAFRILRAFRLITKMKELKDLVNALLSVMPRMFAIFLLLVLIYFVFGVMFTEMFRDAYIEGYTSQDYFSRLDKTAFTLLQFMFLDNWSQITKEVMQKHYWAWAPILTFIVISTFIVINLIIAVICDAVAAIHTEEMTKQVEEMQNLTEDALHHNEFSHKAEIRRLEAKLNDIMRLLTALSQNPAPQEEEAKKLT